MENFNYSCRKSSNIENVVNVLRNKGIKVLRYNSGRVGNEYINLPNVIFILPRDTSEISTFLKSLYKKNPLSHYFIEDCCDSTNKKRLVFCVPPFDSSELNHSIKDFCRVVKELC